MPNSSSLDPGRQPALAGIAAAPDAGLLEQAELVARPGGDGRRLLVGAGGQPVGFSRWQGRVLWRGWPWSALGVHEQEQGPLVFTVRRLLSVAPRREVRDADGELVGVLAGRRVLDRWRRPAMRLRRDGKGGQLLDGQGQPLAAWSDGPGGARLELFPPVWHDPFAKMLILAAFLTARHPG